MPDPPVISPADPYVLAHQTVHVWLVGLECEIRQESEDEMFGSVGVVVPSSRISTVQHFPDGTDFLPMGPDGERTVSLQILLYDGPPADLVLTSVLAEHDSGDLSEYRRRIAEAFVKAANAGGAALGGVPAEAMAANQGWLGDLSVGLANVLTGVIGADDDPYTPQSVPVRAKDMLTAFGIVQGTLPGAQQPFPARTRVRPDTPGVTLAYNIDPVRLTGRDQGGDQGSYAFYYRIDLLFEGVKIF